MDDELLAVNGQDVSQMDHSDIVSLIKSSGMSIHLTVQQPDPGGVCVCVQLVCSRPENGISIYLTDGVNLYLSCVFFLHYLLGTTRLCFA